MPMLKVFYGTDTIATRQAAFGFLSGREEQGASTEVIDGETFQAGMLQDVAGAAPLFGGETIYLLDTPSSNKDFAAETETMLETLAESPNQFVVIEGPLLAADKKKWQKHTKDIEEFKAAAGERFNTFAMADALARKDKKTLWLLLQEAKAAGQSAEEIIGVLWWQLKSLRLSATTGNAAEVGMKDFPYNKAKRSLKNFPEGDLTRLSHELLTVYHDGHHGKRDIDLALERWCLTL